MPPDELGVRLRQVRRMRGWSLRETAEKAGISSAYLQKLESRHVNAPSPHVLHSLAEQLRVPYSTLMELAGYVVPGNFPDDELVHPHLAPAASILAAWRGWAAFHAGAIVAMKGIALYEGGANVLAAEDMFKGVAHGGRAGS